MVDNEYFHKYYLKNKDSIKQKGKERYLKNRDMLIKRSKKWQLKNKEYLKKYMHEYDMKRKDKKKKYNKEYNEKNKETIIEKRKEYYWKNRDKRSDFYYNNKDNILEKHKKWLKTENGKLHERKKNANKRKYGYIELFDDPFDISEKIDWHHVNDFFVVALPSDLHKLYIGKYHRERMEYIVNQIYK